MKNYRYYFLAGLVIVNTLALTGFDRWHIGAFLSFLYIVSAPGMLLLPFFLKKKLAPMLGVAMSVMLSVLLLMLAGFLINIIMPAMGFSAPLTTIPLLSLFDGMLFILLICNTIAGKELSLKFYSITSFSWIVIGLSVALPILACIGAVMLNNSGSNAVTMFTLGMIGVLVLVILTNRDRVDSVVPPITLFMTALTLLLMNSMRGWFITGHDIELEYHVFTLVNAAHQWSMALYQDPYMACLSITILPTYLQNLLHINSLYIFKFFIQFIGALPVVVIYYLSKEYVSGVTAFLAGFLYITFPTFMTDMAFLNRQGVAFAFFSLMIFALLNTEYFGTRARMVLMLLLATGMVLSHYSTSYVAIAVLGGAYLIDRIARLVMTAKWPRWFSRTTDLIANKQGYATKRLLTLPFVIGVFAIIIVWSVAITHTSNNFSTAIQQIAQNVSKPFSLEENSGPASYNILHTSASTAMPTTPFQQFVAVSTQQAEGAQTASDLYSQSITSGYSTPAVSEPTVPLTPLGTNMQAILHQDLGAIYDDVKQFYAKIVQGLLLVGIVGLLLGYHFKRTLLRYPPVEYIALSVSGVALLMGQTILPSNAIDYGLLRLFQQNLIFLALPIALSLIAILGLVVKKTSVRSIICACIFLAFYFVLSGMFPQFTGGGRPPLPLDNYGFYYDAYYTHTQEVAALDWFEANADRYLPVQSDRYFSTIKMITNTGIAPVPGLLPGIIQTQSYVYLNYNNIKTGEVIEVIGGQVIYYKFPIAFLQNNKNLIYNNGGSEFYQ